MGKGRSAKIEIRRWRLRWERVGGRRRGIAERISEKRVSRSLSCGGWAEVQSRIREKRRLAVELQVILALEDIIEDTKSAADTGLPVTVRIPGEPEAGRPVFRIRKVGAIGRRVAGKNQASGGIDEARGLVARNHGERPPLGVIFR